MAAGAADCSYCWYRRYFEDDDVVAGALAAAAVDAADAAMGRLRGIVRIVGCQFY